MNRSPWRQDWSAAGRLLRRLPAFLASPVTPAQAAAWCERAAQQRSRNLLQVLRRCVFSYPASPYAALLRAGGIAPETLVRWLETAGVEETLVRLEGAGVYVTVEEFKGKKPIERAGFRWNVAADDFQNRVYAGDLVARSGGSRSEGLRTLYDLENVACSWTIPILLRLSALDLLDAPLAVGYPPAPGAGPLLLLVLAKGGILPRVWFSPLPLTAGSVGWRGVLGTLWILGAARRAGFKLPRPVVVPPSEPGPILWWIATHLSQRRPCGLFTTVSNALRLAEQAEGTGMRLDGCTLLVSSESLTPAKREMIGRTGARVVPAYATMETGPIGLGCLNPEYADEVHVVEGAVVCRLQARELSGDAGAVDMVRLTGLIPSLPKVLLNTETGDTAQLLYRNCGCPLDRPGLQLHLRGIYGVDKLTGRGTTFLGADLVAVLEEDLPARFGGTALDYQLLEVEEATGETRLVLRVAPRVGSVDGEAVRQWFLKRIAERAPGYRLMAELWRQPNALTVERSNPRPTARGKILPLALERAVRREPSRRKEPGRCERA